MTTRFCPSCETECPVRSEHRTERYKLRGVEYEVAVDVDVCSECGESIFDEVRDGAMVLELYARYRQEHGLLTPVEIKATRERYDLTQESFAALLELSEATINRYEGGCLQEETHDNMIRMAGEPAAMLALLARRGGLLSESQRERGRQAAEAHAGRKAVE